MTEGATFDPDEIISLSSDLRLLSQLTMELSQPTFIQNSVGKLLIEKTPDGARSPNLADAIMMLFAPTETRRGFLNV